MFKNIASRFLSDRAQHSLKRFQSSMQIANGNFHSPEVEFCRLNEWIAPGDWCLDIGANIGHYTYAMSDLAGASGRVLAFEPVPRTFELLAANASHFPHQNVTLLNAAASHSCGMVKMSIPHFDSGLDNYYRAEIKHSASNMPDNHKEIAAMTVTVDGLDLRGKVSLIKIDVEGHEWAAVQGMIQTLWRHQPTLIIEGSDKSVENFLCNTMLYKFSQAKESPNRVYYRENKS